MIYSVIHFGFIQMKSWTKRTPYEKFNTVMALSIIALIFLGVMFGK